MGRFEHCDNCLVRDNYDICEQIFGIAAETEERIVEAFTSEIPEALADKPETVLDASQKYIRQSRERIYANMDSLGCNLSRGELDVQLTLIKQ